MSTGGVLLLGGPSLGFAALATDGSDLEIASDLARCLDRVRTADPPVSLVVLDPGWPQPLAAAQQIRGADGAVAVAVSAPAREVETVRARLAFLPDAGDIEVVAADADEAELRGRLDRLATASRQRKRVRGALDAINRNLAEASPRSPASRSSAVSEHYLATLVRHAADTIVSFDAGGRIVTVNDAGQRMLGLPPTAAEGRSATDLLADDDPGELSAMLTAAAGGRAQVDEELHVRLEGGRRLVLSATAAPVLDAAGTLAGLVLIARDVTTERNAEQQLRALQKAESLATLAGGVAHDFNNLLVQAQGWADLAREDPHDADLVSTALEHVSRATRGAAELSRAMLAYSGRGSFETARVRVATLISDLRPLLDASVPPRTRLELDLDEDPEVVADATQLRQVVLNLVTNATEAIGHEPGTIHVRTTTLEVVDDAPGPRTASPLDAGAYAIIEVSDTGPGIDPEHLDRLCDPFFTTKFTGRGLGLAASQGIARAHGGAITVASSPGEGACFRVHLSMST